LHAGQFVRVHTGIPLDNEEGVANTATKIGMKTTNLEDALAADSSLENVIALLPAMYAEASCASDRTLKKHAFYRCLARLKTILQIEGGSNVPEPAFSVLQRIANDAGEVRKPRFENTSPSNAQVEAKMAVNSSNNSENPPRAKKLKTCHPETARRKRYTNTKSGRKVTMKPSQQSWIEHQRRLKSLDFGAPRKLRKPPKAITQWCPIINGGAVETNRSHH
jgi:hypothetical protein